MVTINLELYDFLKDTEIHLEKINDELKAIAFIDLDDISYFQYCIGSVDIFADDGGIDCKLQDGNICIELNEIFEYQGNCLNDYYNCYSSDDIEMYSFELSEE